MTSAEDHINKLISEVIRLQSESIPPENGDILVCAPGFISDSSGRQIILSSEAEKSIRAVADILKKDIGVSPLTVTDSEWRALVREEFGPVLGRLVLNGDKTINVGAVLAAITEILKQHVSNYGELEFAFDCTLFGNTAIEPFAIGPVRFETRSVWLLRKQQECTISDGVNKCIDITTSDFVCSVKVNGFANKAGRDKALMAARMALAAIALLWRPPSTALDGMNLLVDRRPNLRKILSFAPSRVATYGSEWANKSHGPCLKDSEWKKMFAEECTHFSVVGDILDFVVSPTGKVKQPKLMNTLTQALMWFHEGCRENVDLMAIAKFSATLDALACGGKSGGIKRLINARLRITNDQPIYPEGPTLEGAIKDIYGKGRSCTMHGTNDNLLHDWTGTRILAEQFARLCLIACIDWAAANQSSDDPEQMSKV